MSIGRLIGLIVLVVGILLLVIGISRSDSLGEQVTETVTGEYTERTQWYIYGGIAAAVIGAALLVFGGPLIPLNRTGG